MPQRIVLREDAVDRSGGHAVHICLALNHSGLMMGRGGILQYSHNLMLSDYFQVPQRCEQRLADRKCRQTVCSLILLVSLRHLAPAFDWRKESRNMGGVRSGSANLR